MAPPLGVGASPLRKKFWIHVKPLGSFLKLSMINFRERKVQNPTFPRPEAVSNPKVGVSNLLFWPSFSENCMKMKINWKKGSRDPNTPLGPANASV